MSIITKMQRFTNKSIGIILDRHNIPPPAQKLTLDTEGEYVEFKELKGMLDTGLLIEMSAELQETFLDAQAQRSLITTLTNMGYEDFDQVLQVLREQRATVLKERSFEIWSVGYQATGEFTPPNRVATTTALSFEEACRKLHDAYKANGVHSGPASWIFDEETLRWRDYCGYLVDTKPAD